MASRRLTACTLLAILVVTRAYASDEGPSPERPRRFSVTFAAGSHWQDRGHVQALSFGYLPARAWTLLLNVERGHVPTRVRRYPDGYSASRGGTLTSITGEVRQTVWRFKRIAPFWLAGGGAAEARASVDEIFPDRRTRVVRVLYGGGGLLISLHPALALSVDAKLLVAEQMENLLVAKAETEILRLPIRAGVTWRF